MRLKEWHDNKLATDPGYRAAVSYEERREAGVQADTLAIMLGSGLTTRVPFKRRHGLYYSRARATVGHCVFCGGCRACPTTASIFNVETEHLTRVLCIDCGAECWLGDTSAIPFFSRIPGAEPGLSMVREALDWLMIRTI